MPTKGERTRESILSTAESLILSNGYSGTSIDQIIGESGITKGGFFYHFDGKNDLAKHLVMRYLEQDEVFFNGLF
ncbi:MAG: helix-turn-helix domain-containing protein, partial [Pseudomonadota bacterium]